MGAEDARAEGCGLGIASKVAVGFGANFGSSAKVTIELKKKGSHGKLPFGEKGVEHENPTGIVLGKWGDLPL